jgi:HTH-like domain
VATTRACELARFSRAAFYRQSQAKDQSALRLRIREIAHARPRFGYQRIHVMLRPEGWAVNKKRIRRLYRLDGLQLLRIRRRKHTCLHRGPVPTPSAPHERWRMDFVHDQLFDGRPFRILTVVDQLSRESPLIEVSFGMSGQRMADAIDAQPADVPLPPGGALLRPSRCRQRRVELRRLRTSRLNGAHAGKWSTGSRRSAALPTARIAPRGFCAAVCLRSFPARAACAGLRCMPVAEDERDPFAFRGNRGQGCECGRLELLGPGGAADERDRDGTVDEKRIPHAQSI